MRNGIRFLFVSTAVLASCVLSKPLFAASSTNAVTLLWPTTSHAVSQHYSAHHHAIDIPAAAGQPLYAPADAKIYSVQQGGYNEGYGNTIIFALPNNLMVRYAHLQNISVTKGQMVKKGDQVGTVGTTGLTTGPQVHVEVIRAGVRINPLTVFKQ